MKKPVETESASNSVAMPHWPRIQEPSTPRPQRKCEAVPTDSVDGQKRVHLETWGCQMNVADSERMLSILGECDYQKTETAEDADLIILNTCHIREKAKHKVVSRLGRLKELKLKNPNLQIAVAGCVAQAEGRRLLKQAPQIDLLFGPGKIDALPELLQKSRQSANNKVTQVALGFNRARAYEAFRPKGSQAVAATKVPTLSGKNEISRYVNIQHGCNNCCTFCVVPFTRGQEVSKSKEEIIAECQNMVDHGAREITLLGQNVNSYGLPRSHRLDPMEPTPFSGLLAEVARIEGLKRLRFTTSNPHDFTRPLAELFNTQSKLGRYMHLPVQSGSDPILESMKRKVTKAQYLERVHWLREEIPDMAVSTDIIVGFPGETDRDFEETLSLVQEVKFSFIYAFKYSKRNNTVASRMSEQVAEDVMSLRLKMLNQVQDAISAQQGQREIGQTREVLFLYESRKVPGTYYGRTQYFRLVRVVSPMSMVGKVLPITIESADKTALSGRLAN